MKFPYRSLSLATGLLFAGLAAPVFAKPDQPTPTPSAPLIAGLDDLKQLDHQLASIADRTAAATVSLVSATGGAAGSGVIVSREGLILSAGHVIAAIGGDVIVIFPDGKRAKAKSLGADFDRDAAMVRITDPGDYPFVETAPSEPLPVNGWCMALGHPGGFDPLRTPPLRLGRILGYGDFVVTDCTVVSGDSGGPLFDTEGRVIGIHSNIGSSLGENRHVPIKVFRDQWDDLVAGKRKGTRFDQKPGGKKPGDKKPEAKQPDAPKSSAAATPDLGLKFGTGGPEGLTIDAVAKDSPAAKAGLMPGDVVVRVAGRKAVNAKEFEDAVAARMPRPNVMLAYRRDGKVNRIRLTTAAPAQPKPATAADELNGFIDKALADAKGGKAELKLTPELVEKFGGMERIQQALKERLEHQHGGTAKAEAKDPPKPAAPKTEQEKDELFAKLRQRAQANAGRLEITPEELKELGGIEEIRKRMGSAPAMPDAFFTSVTNALKPVVKEASGGTAAVLVDGKPVALGTVVTATGGILTKDSETAKGAVRVKLAGKEYPATLVKRYPAWDLALFHITAEGLHPVALKAAADSPARGSILTVSGPDPDPLGIGVVSVNSRPLAQIGFLGIEAQPQAAADGGVVVKQTVKDGPADKAGFKAGDVIAAVNGAAISDPSAFTKAVVKFKTGDVVKFEVRRGAEKLTLEAKLGERPIAKMGKDFLKVNQMSGPLSPKTDGFPLVLQHDIPLEPAQCGGPLLDLDGRCVGINVARAGRVNTLAIPAGKVADLVAGAKADLANAAAKAAPTVTAEDLAEVTKALEDIQLRLKQLEQRLKPVPAR